MVVVVVCCVGCSCGLGVFGGLFVVVGLVSVMVMVSVGSVWLLSGWMCAVMVLVVSPGWKVMVPVSVLLGVPLGLVRV